MYNIMVNSDVPDRYPMNRLSDMFTNFIGVMFGIVVLCVGVNPVFLVMQLFLCVVEMFEHTKSGIFSYKRFKEQGKKTIYNPGLFTTVFGYLPVAVAIIVSFSKEAAPCWWQWIVGIVCGTVLGGISLKLPEKLTLDKNSPYAFHWGKGYFKKYVKDNE